MRGIVRAFVLPIGLLAATASMSAADDQQPPPIDLDAPSGEVAPVDDSIAIDNSAKRATIAMGHYEAEKWSEARAEFIRAFELYPLPQYLFYIGDTHRREGAFRMALMYYHRFLESSAPSSWLRQEAEEYTDQLHRAISQRSHRINIEERRHRPVLAPAAPSMGSEPPMMPAPMTPMETDRDPRSNTKLAFAVSGILTAGAAVFWGYSGTRVLHFEDEKEQALIDAAQNGVTFDVDDACDDADGRSGASAARVSEACDSGQRWAIVTNAALATTLVGVGVTSYLGYRAYLAKPERERGPTVRLAPTLGPTSVGLAGAVDF